MAKKIMDKFYQMFPKKVRQKAEKKLSQLLFRHFSTYGKNYDKLYASLFRVYVTMTQIRILPSRRMWNLPCEPRYVRPFRSVRCCIENHPGIHTTLEHSVAG